MIVSFYSYKGGVGRTQLCANVAAYLCNYKGKRVLLWDWDYEAPGLHYFFEKKNSDITRPGTLELMESYMALMRKSKEKVQTADLKFITEENITSLVTAETGCIDLMAAGIYNNDFSFRATNFDWFEFYNMFDGVNYIEQLKEHLKHLNYDYILIDSRTGISDYSGICNIQLPDVNVMVIAATMQNFEGCKSIIEKIQNAEYLKIVGRQAKIFPVLSRVDTGNEIYNVWAQKFKEYFSHVIRNLDNEFDDMFLSEIFTDVYYNDTLISYNQAIALGENILFKESSKRKPDSDISSRPFRNIAEYLDIINRDKTISFYKAVGERDWLRYAEKSEIPRKIAIAYTQVAIRQSNPDNILKYCEKAINKDKTYYLPFYQGAIALSTQGETTKAIKYLEESIALNPDFGEAYYHLGSEYLNIGRNELGKDYLKKALALNPEHLEARNKLVNLRSGNINISEQKIKEDDFFNEYVNKKIEQSKQENETYVQKKIKRSNAVAYLSVIISIIFLLIVTMLYYKNKNNKNDQANDPPVTSESINVYQKLSDSITNLIKVNGPGDTSFQKNTADDVRKLNQIYDSLTKSNSNNYFWVYLGQRTNKGWNSQNFEFDDISSIGNNITATTDVYKRDNEPSREPDKTWKLGKVIGVITEGQTVSVEKIDSVQSANYWALVKENQSDFWVVQLTTHLYLDTAIDLRMRYNKRLRLRNLRILHDNKYSYIISQNFNSQDEAEQYKLKYRKYLRKDVLVVKLSSICTRMIYTKPYFQCK